MARTREEARAQSLRQRIVPYKRQLRGLKAFAARDERVREAWIHSAAQGQLLSGDGEITRILRGEISQNAHEHDSVGSNAQIIPCDQTVKQLTHRLVTNILTGGTPSEVRGTLQEIRVQIEKGEYGNQVEVNDHSTNPTFSILSDVSDTTRNYNYFELALIHDVSIDVIQVLFENHVAWRKHKGRSTWDRCMYAPFLCDYKFLPQYIHLVSPFEYDLSNLSSSGRVLCFGFDRKIEFLYMLMRLGMKITEFDVKNVEGLGEREKRKINQNRKSILALVLMTYFTSVTLTNRLSSFAFPSDLLRLLKSYLI